MSESNQIPVVTIDGKHYAIDNLSDDARSVVDVLKENEILQSQTIAQHRQLQLAREVLSAKLQELVADIEPVETAEEVAEAPAPVTVTE